VNYLTIGIGALFLMYGILTIFLRIKSPDKLKKIESFKAKYGELGKVYHFISYSFAPLLLGFVFVFLGFRGVTFF
jgi:hypothetical protein